MSETLQKQIDELRAELAELKLTRIARLKRAIRRNKKIAFAIASAIILVPTAIFAFAVTNTFTAGTAAQASQVNQNFTDIATQLTAMENKSWRLIYENDVAVNATSINIAGLNGNSDKTYMIIMRIYNAGLSTANYTLRPNSDSGSNYGFQYLNAAGGSAGAGKSATNGYTGLQICYAANAQQCESHSFFYAATGAPRVLQASITYNVTAGDVAGFQNYATSWNNSGTNITNLVLNSDILNGIGAGSHIEIWARR